MKHLIIILTIISFSTYGFSQSKKSNNLVNFDSLKSPSLKLFLHSDTLEIFDYRTIRFIKIGDNIYEIKSPTIEKVEKQPSFPQGGFFTLPKDTLLNMKYFLPNGSIII